MERHTAFAERNLAPRNMERRNYLEERSIGVRLNETRNAVIESCVITSFWTLFTHVFYALSIQYALLLM